MLRVPITQPVRFSDSTPSISARSWKVDMAQHLFYGSKFRVARSQALEEQQAKRDGMGQ